MQLDIKKIFEIRINNFLYDLRHDKYQITNIDTLKVWNKIILLENDINNAIYKNQLEQYSITLAKELSNIINEVKNNEVK